jgi:hypothetical protein
MKNEYEIRGDVTVIFLNRKRAKIPIETVISTSDLEKVKSFTGRWFAMWHQQGQRYYVKGHLSVNGKQKAVLLHRWLFDNPKGYVIDHVNHDSLKNVRSNLRVVTQGQNNQNKKGASKNSKSGIRGVHWNKQANKWQAQIGLNNKVMYLGLFNDLPAAEWSVIEARKKFMPYSQERKVN